MAIYAIGDIHGCLKSLETVYAAFDFQDDDKLVLLGDYVDRGPHSSQVLDWILARKDDHLITLCGNHEIMMLDARYYAPSPGGWLGFGGKETLMSYGIQHQNNWFDHIPDDHWHFMENTLPYHKEGHFIFVHAGLEAGIALEDQSPKSLYWDKLSDPIPYSAGAIVVCGHTAQKSGVIANYGHTICIDTFAYGGQWLTCLEVTSGSFWQGNQEGELRSGVLSLDM